MDQFLPYLVASFLLGAVAGWYVGRATRGWGRRHTARVIGVHEADEHRTKDPDRKLEVSVALPIQARRRVSVGDHITVMLR